MKVCDKTCIFFFFPIINKYFLMAKRSLLSRCPSYFARYFDSKRWATGMDAKLNNYGIGSE